MNLSAQVLKRASDFLEKKNLDAMLLTGRENNRYFSGFTGSDSTLLIVAGERGNFIFTDSRYTEQAGQQCTGWTVIEYKRVTETIAKKIKELKLSKVAFESRHVSYNLYHRYIEALNNAVLIPQEKAIDLLRAVKLPEEIDAIREAANIAEKAIEKCLPELKPGMREDEFSLMLEYEVRKQGSGPVPFEFIVASGPRGAMAHGVASDKIIKKNEMVTIDFGASYKGYMCDTTVTVGIGNPPKEMTEVYQVVKDAHDIAIEGIKPGMELKLIDDLARKYIDKKGFGKFFGHGLGHGVGLAVHEEPSLSPLADGEIPENTVVTVEPGIYIPGTGGVRIESMVHVTAEGATALTKFPKNMQILQ